MKNRISTINCFFIVICAVILITCKKPEEVTIGNNYAPISLYYPVFPGSYWIYTDSLGNKSIKKVESEYVPKEFKTADDSLNELIYYPKMDEVYYYGECYLTRDVSPYYPCNDRGDTFEPFLLLSGSSRISRSYNCLHHQELIENNNLVYVKKLDTLVVNNSLYRNVIINKSYISYSGFTSGFTAPPIHHTLYYYAENIGLILQQQINHPDSVPDTLLVKSLIEYKINK
jgi:hypothetical protein